MGRRVRGTQAASERLAVRVEPALKEAIVAKVGQRGIGEYLRRLIEADLAGPGALPPAVLRPRALASAGHEWVGVGTKCMRMGCEYPKDKGAHR